MSDSQSRKAFLHPKKLQGTKWTATVPLDREKHFVVTRVVEPDLEGQPPELVEIEAVHSRRVQTIRWQELLDASRWRQGWC